MLMNMIMNIRTKDNSAYNNGMDLVVAIAIVFVAIANGNNTCLCVSRANTFLLLVLTSLSFEEM